MESQACPCSAPLASGGSNPALDMWQVILPQTEVGAQAPQTQGGSATLRDTAGLPPSSPLPLPPSSRPLPSDPLFRSSPRWERGVRVLQGPVAHQALPKSRASGLTPAPGCSHGGTEAPPGPWNPEVAGRIQTQISRSHCHSLVLSPGGEDSCLSRSVGWPRGTASWPGSGAPSWPVTSTVCLRVVPPDPAAPESCLNPGVSQ